MQLYTKILIGLIAGIVTGGVANFADIVWMQELLQRLEPIGTVFIRLIMMIVIPLIVASLILGTASLGDIKKLGRLGGKTIAFYLCTTAVAVTIGLLISNIVRPGAGIDPATRDAIAADFEGDAASRLQLAADRPSVGETLLNMIPTNPFRSAAEGELLPLIIFSVIFGAAISLVARDRRESVLLFFNGVNDAVMVIIDWIMKLAPYAVFALVGAVVSRFGLDLLRSLALYTVVVATGLLLHVLITYMTLVKVLGGISPLTFVKRIAEVPLVAFSTSSSSATLPVTMEVAQEKLGVSRETSSFVLPLGATVNMDGTALYQAVAVMFIAQIYGIPLGIGEQLTIVLTATLASIGAAGVPSAGIITLILVLQSVGLGTQAQAGIALILGVDRLLDMVRTAVNVTGDLTAATVIARSEGEELVPHPVDHPIAIGGRTA
ncbi:MAG TPA: dicarboxylate/amino acid:cation symporter [Longimicrobiales bacterium]|nr:dicarboxylate/amino acid:cation symporter [Longimicrobiales bacterium]